MSIELITILLVVIFVTLLLTGLPLAWVMGATSCIFTLILFEPSTMYMSMTRVYHMMLNYTLVAVPLFVFMGSMLERSGIIERLYDALYLWLGGFRGGLAVVTILVGTVMAATVGIITASVTLLTLVALPSW